MTISLFENYPTVTNSADLGQPILLSATKADSYNKVKQNGRNVIALPNFQIYKRENNKILRSYSSSKYCLPDISDAFINLMAAKELIIKKKTVNTHTILYSDFSAKGLFHSFWIRMM